MIRARACCRVDLAGGTLDLWPIGLQFPGASTVNVAVDVHVEARMRRRDAGYRVRQSGETYTAETPSGLREIPATALVGVVAAAMDLPPVEIELESESPQGGGLGASSALAVALIATGEELCGKTPSSPRQRARLARDLEARLMGLPTGLQDHYPALLGGALRIVHAVGGERVEHLDVDLEALGESLLLFFTGKSHFSAGQNWDVVRRFFSGETEVWEHFGGIARVAAELGGALEAGDFEHVGRLVGEEWSHRRRLAEGITTPEIERALETAQELGAWGGKACGAGGGGCLAVLAPPARREAVAERLAAQGLTRLAAWPSAGALWVESVASATNSRTKAGRDW